MFKKTGAGFLTALLLIGATSRNDRLIQLWSRYTGWTFGGYIANENNVGPRNIRMKGRLGQLPFILIRTPTRIGYRLYNGGTSPILRIDLQDGQISAFNAASKPTTLSESIRSQFVAEMLILTNSIADYEELRQFDDGEYEQFDISPKSTLPISISLNKASGECAKIVVHAPDRDIVYIPTRASEFVPGKKIYTVWQRNNEPPIYIDNIQVGVRIYEGE